MLTKNERSELVHFKFRIILESSLPWCKPVRATEGRVVHHCKHRNGKYPQFLAETAGHQETACAFDREPVFALGTPVAFIEIPSIGLRQVVGEGTAASELLHGPGHRRDTPLPGQVGTSVVFGRRAAFGGPFSRIAELTKGAEIKVTTGQGADFTFRVIAVRRDGDPAPAAAARGTSRLTLVTAAGRAFFPEGVLRVDADLEGQAVVGPARLISASGLPAPERLMAGDTRTLWALALWLQALIALSIGAVWAWHRWGRVQTWIVFLPALLLVGLCVSGEAARLLPNLL